MSRNAAGLASICILSTMVLVTVSTTVSLYKGLDAYAAVRWPQDMTLTLMTDPQTNTVPDVAPVLQVVDDAMTRAGLTQSNVHGYRTVQFSTQRSGDALNQFTGSGAMHTTSWFWTRRLCRPDRRAGDACARRGARMDGRRSLWRHAHARRRYAAAAAAR